MMPVGRPIILEGRGGYFTQWATHTLSIIDAESKKLSTYCTVEGANWVGMQKETD